MINGHFAEAPYEEDGDARWRIRKKPSACCAIPMHAHHGTGVLAEIAQKKYMRQRQEPVHYALLLPPQRRTHEVNSALVPR